MWNDCVYIRGLVKLGTPASPVLEILYPPSAMFGALSCNFNLH